MNGSIGKIVAFQNVQDALRENIEIAQEPEKDQEVGYDSTWEGLKYAGASRAAKTRLHSRKSRNAGVTGEPPPVPLYQRQGTVWPIVQFTSGRKYSCVPVSFEAVDARGRTLAWREQVRLISDERMNFNDRPAGATYSRMGYEHP